MSRPVLALATSLLALTGLATLDAHADAAAVAPVEKKEAVPSSAEAAQARSDAIARAQLEALLNDLPVPQVEADAAAVVVVQEPAEAEAVEAAVEVDEVAEEMLPVKHFGGY